MAEELGLSNIGDELIKSVEQSWRLYPPVGGAGAARNVCVFVSGGASGTG